MHIQEINRASHSASRCRKLHSTLLDLRLIGLLNPQHKQNAAPQRKKRVTHHPQMGSVRVDNCLRPFTYVNITAINYLARSG